MGVTATNLPETTPAATAARLAERASARVAEPPEAIQQAIDAICALLSGEEADLSFITCDDVAIAPFERDVYAVTRTIPAGDTRTYGDIARQLGDIQLSRQVGQSLGRNPLPIIIPCHRVMGAGGKLTGFSAHGGVDTKLKLLDIEKAAMGLEGGLFGHLPLAVKSKE